MVMMRIYEEKILKMIMSNWEFTEEDFKRKGRGLVNEDDDKWGKYLEDDQERQKIHWRRL